MEAELGPHKPTFKSIFAFNTFLSHAASHASSHARPTFKNLQIRILKYFPAPFLAQF
jgi:hypothetical protein